MASLDQIRRLKIEVSETGAADATGKVKTLGDAYAQMSRQMAMLSQEMATFDRNLNQQRSFDGVARGVGGMATALREVGGLMKEHPVITLAAAAASARAIGMLSPALTTASIATRGLANDNNALLGPAIGVAARGMGVLATATAGVSAAAKEFGETYGGAALKAVSAASSTASAMRLVSTAFGVVVPLLGPIALGLTAIKLGGDALEKAFSDYEKLVALGQKSERLELAAPIIKSFEGLGKQLRLEISDMDAALENFSQKVRMRFGEEDALVTHLSKLYSQGLTGGEKLPGQVLAETAKTNEERFTAALTAMRDLDAIGQRLAAIDLADKFFSPTVADAIRRARGNTEQIASDLEEASRKEVLSADQARRAADLSREVSDVKKEIAAAVTTTFDFSAAAMALDNVWLSVLKTTRDVVVAMNEALTIKPPAGPSESKYEGLLQSQAKFIDLIEKADQATARGITSAAERAENSRRQLGVVNDELARYRNLMDPEYRRESNRAAGLSAMPDPNAPIGGRQLSGQPFGPPMPKIEAPKVAAPAGPSGDTLDAMDRYVRDLEKARDVAKAEFETIGLGNQARERAIDLAKAQAAVATDFQRGLRNTNSLTDEETQRIIAAADATVMWRDRMREVQDATNFAREASSSFAKDFVHGLQQGQSAMESLTSAIDRLATKLMDKSIDGVFDGLFGKSGGGGGVFGNLFGGSGGAGVGSGFGGVTLSDGALLMHSGGIVGSGSSGWRNVHPAYFDDAPRYERGGIAGFAPNEVPIVAHTGEEILTASDPRHRNNRGGGEQSITIAVDVRGASGNEEVQRMVAAGVTQGLKAYDRGLPRKVSLITDAKRGGRGF